MPEVAGPDGLTRKLLIGSDVPYHVLPFTRRNDQPLKELRSLATVFSLVRRGRFNLVHAHASKAGVYGRIAGMAARTPIVYTPHCFGFVGPVSQRRKVVSLAAERILSPLTDAILCVSQGEYNIAQRTHIASTRKLCLTRQGIPALDSDVLPDPDILAMRERGPVIGAVNVFRRQKRTDLLLSAIPEVWKRHPEAQFVVVGQGSLENDLRDQARALGIQHDRRFRFAPFTPPTEKYLFALDLFVLTSDWEALSIGLLEAMAAGVPQVVTNIAGNSEAVTPDTGVLVRSGDPLELAAAITRLVAEPDRLNAMRAASRERYERYFVFSRMLEETVNAYALALEGM